MWTLQKKVISISGLVFLGIIVGIILTSQFDLTPKGFADGHDKNTEFKVLNVPVAKTNPQIGGTEKGFTDICKKMLPTVVSISTSKIVTRSSGGNDLWGPILRDFFGREYEFKSPEPQKQHGLGSGILISKEGYILTNHHVVQNADDIKVTLYDKRSFDAELVGTDPLTEVAVIKIDGKDFPSAQLGNSEELEIGEWVLAIGNPLTLTSTVTAGIVSAKGRDINIIRDENAEQTGGSFAIESFIQTDAAINRGNSGGALVNMKAQVIGINTAIASGTGYYAGYGFAIPINLAKKIMKDLIEKGHVVRAYVGIGMKSVNEQVASRYNLEKPVGVYIDQIMDGSPAEKSGLKELDLILKLNDKPIQEANQVQNAIALKKPGDIVTLTILRESSERNFITKEIKVKLGKKETGKEFSENKETEMFTNIGLEVQDLTDEIRSSLDYYRYDSGVVVTKVESGGSAEKAGIRRGSIITQIEDNKIKSIADYRKALRKYDDGSVVIFYLKYRNTKYHAFVEIIK